MAAAVAVLDVLLADDDAGDAFMVEEAFASHHVPARLHVVTDGLEALAFLRNEDRYAHALRPHLILLDLNMPRMDGREALAVIKQDPQLSSIPVVVLTTSAAEADVLAAYRLHAAAYITKPIDLDDFTNVIHKIKDFYGTLAELPTS
jgi:two-component system response regulator